MHTANIIYFFKENITLNSNRKIFVFRNEYTFNSQQSFHSVHYFNIIKVILNYRICWAWSFTSKNKVTFFSKKKKNVLFFKNNIALSSNVHYPLWLASE